MFSPATSVLVDDAADDEEKPRRGGKIYRFADDEMKEYHRDERCKEDKVTDPVGCLSELQGFQPEPECDSHLEDAAVD